MPLSVIWIDRNVAKLFHLSAERMARKTFQAHSHNHHQPEFDEDDAFRPENPLFRELSAEIGQADQILILGPGMAKHHFQNFLIEHSPMQGKKIIGCETVEHPTDTQIASIAMKFIKPPARRLDL